jgi:hypothetical protein
MSMQVLPTAPSPTVTHLMNREALDAIAARPSPILSSQVKGRSGRGGCKEMAVREGTDCVLWFLGRLVRDLTCEESEDGHLTAEAPGVDVLFTFYSLAALLAQEAAPRKSNNCNFGAYTVLILQHTTTVVRNQGPFLCDVGVLFLIWNKKNALCFFW